MSDRVRGALSTGQVNSLMQTLAILTKLNPYCLCTDDKPACEHRKDIINPEYKLIYFFYLMEIIYIILFIIKFSHLV